MIDQRILSSELSQALGAVVEVERVTDDESRVFAPFTFPDGDQLVIRARQLPEGGLEWTDVGHTFMHLSYWMDVETLGKGARGRLLDQTIGRFGAQDRDGELVLPTNGDDLGSSFLRFAQFLTHVADLDYLTQDRVRSTFADDFNALLDAAFAGRAQFDYVDQERDPKGHYKIDCLINSSERPIAVFAVPGDDRCRDATITVQKFREWDLPLFFTAVFADLEQINRRVLARFVDASDKQFSSLAGNEEDIVGYIERELSR